MVGVFFAFIVRLLETKQSLHRQVAAQGLVEYALILAFVVIVVIGILAMTGQTTCRVWYEEIYAKLTLTPDTTALTGVQECQK